MIVLGDYNAYAQEDPIAALEAGGLVDQIEAFVSDPATRYTYVYDGQAGSLDQALTTPAMTSQVAGVTLWHIDADEPAVIDYNLEYKSPDLYSATPYRASDHDPVIVGLNTGNHPALSSTDLQGPFAVGQTGGFHVQVANPAEGGSYASVRLDVKLVDASLADVAALEVWDGSAWQTVSLAQSGADLTGSIGAESGFAMAPGYAETRELRVRFTRPGSFALAFTLEDRVSTSTLATLAGTATVIQLVYLPAIVR